ncbi:SMP-30/gluconolactonase/LRE family protein [Vibrio sp. ER1A]|uniref:SMP-30/gluconolactonase/LRE family protein n=1 Tax=Vibrio sp. ER1A TaxID=1517681 RepID=UPI0004DD3329|nr:SMP-30/gluconolactonase/LRE family protein [Vibrio sp. ER1A]KFA97720.1 cag pathogenicity island protein Cag25 [Vibrio sp. ER1A]
MHSVKGIKTTIGESPIWKPDTNSLVWVEAAGSEIFEYSIHSQSTQVFHVPFDITAIARCEGNGWICASKQGLFFCTSSFDDFTPIADPCFGSTKLHLNDAVTAPNGHLWFGSMNHKQLEAPDGKLYRLTANTALEMDSGFSVANGIAFNPALKRAYCSNMFQRKVYEYQLDDSMTQIIEKAVFVELDECKGYPDGLSVDRHGNLYICHWDCGIISYYTPSQTKIGHATQLGEINLAVKHATRCTFGGKDFNTLFVTTADYELTNQESVLYPSSGELFILDAPTQGREEYRVNTDVLSHSNQVNVSLTS